VVSGRRAKQNRAANGGPRAKRHHVVPQSYLKAWADDRNQVTVFDGRTGRSFTTDTKNAAVRAKQYVICLPDGTEDNGLEDQFARAEGDLIGVIRDLRAGIWPLTNEGRSLIGNFIALQIARAPGIPEATERMIGEVSEMANKVEAAMERMKRDLPPDEYEQQAKAWSRMGAISSGESYTLDEFLEMHRYPTLGALDAMADLVEPIAHLKFTLLESQQEEFLTSDQPVAHWAIPGQPAWMGTGLLNAEKSTLPISPNLCLQFEVPDASDVNLDNHRRIPPIEVARINQQTARCASRHIVMRPGFDYLGFNFGAA
jgi:Protein of unknown function (DUF4238)